MTIDEASERYGIPLEILHEYESWGLCDTVSESESGGRSRTSDERRTLTMNEVHGTVKKVMGAWQYDDEDVERLSMIMTLHDIGFENHEVETYMQLLLKGESTKEQRMAMLNRRRKNALEEIHFRESQMDRLDYLRHSIRSAKQ